MTEASLSGAGLYIFAALPLLFLFGRNECSRVGAEGVEQQLSLGMNLQIQDFLTHGAFYSPNVSRSLWRLISGGYSCLAWWLGA